MRMLNRALLNQVAAGQQQRNISSGSIAAYLSKMRVLTCKINEIDDLRLDALEFDINGNPLRHTNAASEVLKLKLPMTVETGQLLFAALSIDGSLPRKRRHAGLIPQQAREDELEQQDVIDLPQVQLATPTNINQLNIAENILTVSAQSYQNYKSALKWWHEYNNADYDKVGVNFPSDVDKAINSQIASYKRDVAKKKRRGIMSQKEGKSPYNLMGYIELCTYFMKIKPSGHRYTWMCGIFAQLFTKLSVNTIGRSDNIDDLLLDQFDWENDHFTVGFSATKSDQTGEKTSEKKRLFANPLKPEICVVYGLAIYTWCKRRNPGDRQLFDGVDQNKRYYNILMTAVQSIPDHINLGCSRKDIGTHSNRKFAESTSVSRVDGPSRTQVCLRAGQSVGRSQDCYMFTEDDGDSLVGRTVAQLKFDADEFDVLPCHFGTQTLAELHIYGWNNILPGFDNLPKSFQRVVPYLFASIVHHYHTGDMSRLFPIDHPIWMQGIFTDRQLISSLQQKVILVYSDCKDTMMFSQGVPGFIAISREIRNFRAHYDSVCQQYCDKITQLSADQDRRDNVLPQRLANVLLEQFQINGTTPITIESMRRLILDELVTNDGPLSQIRNSIDQMRTEMHRNGSQNRETTTTVINPIDNNAHSNLHVWPVGDGRLHRVPYGFRWPSYNTSTIWNLWFFGDLNRSIGPYKSISREHDLTRGLCKVNYSRTKSVMKALTEFAIRDGRIRSVADVNQLNHQDVFDNAMPLLMQQLYPEPHERPIDLNINTLYNRMQRNHG